MRAGRPEHMVCRDERPFGNLMQQPTVSVAIPVYQGARFLEASLRSVLAQSFRDFDLTIVDDDSTDGSREIAARIAETHGHGIPIRIIRNEMRRGLVGNWNRCLELCSGKYVLIFHQDDVLDPGMLQRSVDAFEQHPGVGLVCSAWRCIDEAQHDLPPWSTSPFIGRAGGTPVLEALIRENFICCPSVVVPRDVYERVGRYDARFAFSADFEMWLRIASRYEIFCCPELGLRYRLHSSQATQDFRTARRTRGELEYLSAAVVALHARRQTYPQLWRTVMRDSIWMLRRHAIASPADALWAFRILATRPLDLLRGIRDSLLERVGLRGRDHPAAA
jgi:glycosyltransferase involved in cell wall biosynthesis